MDHTCSHHVVHRPTIIHLASYSLSHSFLLQHFKHFFIQEKKSDLHLACAIFSTKSFTKPRSVLLKLCSMVHRGFHGQKSLKHARLSKICCCCCSVAKSCLTFCNPMDCSIPGSSVLCYLPELAKLKFTSTESVMLSNYLICFRSFFFCLQSFPASGSFSLSWLLVVKVLELQLQHQSFQ